MITPTVEMWYLSISRGAMLMKTSERERLRRPQESDALQITSTLCDVFFDPIEDLPSIGGPLGRFLWKALDRVIASLS